MSPPASPSPWLVYGRSFWKCCFTARLYIALVDLNLLPASGPGKLGFSLQYSANHPYGTIPFFKIAIVLLVNLLVLRAFELSLSLAMQKATKCADALCRVVMRQSRRNRNVDCFFFVGMAGPTCLSLYASIFPEMSQSGSCCNTLRAASGDNLLRPHFHLSASISSSV